MLNHLRFNNRCWSQFVARLYSVYVKCEEGHSIFHYFVLVTAYAMCYRQTLDCKTPYTYLPRYQFSLLYRFYTVNIFRNPLFLSFNLVSRWCWDLRRNRRTRLMHVSPSLRHGAWGSTNLTWFLNSGTPSAASLSWIAGPSSSSNPHPPSFSISRQVDRTSLTGAVARPNLPEIEHCNHLSPTSLILFDYRLYSYWRIGTFGTNSFLIITNKCNQFKS